MEKHLKAHVDSEEADGVDGNLENTGIGKRTFEWGGGAPWAPRNRTLSTLSTINQSIIPPF